MKKGIAVGIIALFIVSTVSPMVIGFSLKEEDRGVSVLEDIPGVEWSRTYGGYGNDNGEYARWTSDGGYVIVGDSKSFSSDGYEAGFLIKTDIIGNVEWYKEFGKIGPYNVDFINAVKQTPDNGFILAGSTNSYGKKAQLWLIKTDENGNEIWNRTYGGKEVDVGWEVHQTLDGGYVAGGMTVSFGAGDIDFWLLKTDSEGNEMWNKTFGGAGQDYGHSMDITDDGGYVLTGDTSLYGGRSLWLVKTDMNGVEEWNISFKGPKDNVAGFSVKQTNDVGYIVTGYIEVQETPKWRCLLLKTDDKGNEIWNQSFKGPEHGWDVQETIDGGYIIVGEKQHEPLTAYLIKTDAYGEKEWEIKFIEEKADSSVIFKSVQQTPDGGFIVGGRLQSKRPFDLYSDFWLVKVGHIPDMNITRPENALYLNNIRLFPTIFMPRIIGPINVNVDASDDEYDIEKVEFYIDDKLKGEDTTEPYSWNWVTPTFFKHTLKAVAYNSNGNVGIEEKVVRKFL